MSWCILVYRKGFYRQPTHSENFIGSQLEAEKRLSECWDDYTPCDGTAFRATLRPAGEDRLTMKIEG